MARMLEARSAEMTIGDKGATTKQSTASEPPREGVLRLRFRPHPGE